LEQLVKIELFGQRYTFKADADVTQAKEVADFLVDEVTKIESRQAGSSSKLTILILAALNIANENIELKRNHSNFLHLISKRSAALLSALE
jgi:cell division protein ZapA (FtsZ GTPase activity inhibitor)